MPRVGVIIPAFESEACLADALDSVLHQTYQDLAVVVVDDGSSTCAAEEIVGRFADKAAFPMSYVYQANRGPSAARNRGLAEIDSEFVAFLDADDIFLPHKLKLQVALLDARPSDYAFVCGGGRVVSAGGRRRDLVPIPADGQVYRTLVDDGPMLKGTPAFLHRRACLDAVAGFDESLGNNEDLDLTLRLARRYRILTHGDVVFEARRRLGSLSSGDPDRALANALRFLDKLEQDDADMSPSNLRRKRQRAWFNAARNHLFTQGDFAAFRRTLSEGIERAGAPMSWRGHAALAFSHTGRLGDLVTRLWKKTVRAV